MRFTALAFVFAACGGNASGADAGDTSTVDGSTDSSGVDGSADGSVDAVNTEDAATDTTTRLEGPRGVEPPETDLEPGSNADDVYRYCWLLADLVCEGHHTCCATPGAGEDRAECLEQFSEGVCGTYLARPDAIGDHDREELESSLVALAQSVDDCAEPATKLGIALGGLDIGGDCSAAEAYNPHLLCTGGVPCVDGVCTSVPEIGEPCAPPGTGGQCEFFTAYCNEDDICAERVELGVECTDPEQCISNACDEVCVEDESDPWCLGFDD